MIKERLTPEYVQNFIRLECDDIRDFLIEKNIKYGNSALDPIRLYSNSNPLEQIKVRLDDKLSRIKHGKGEDEDVDKDIIGYLILKRVLEKHILTDVDKISDTDKDIIDSIILEPKNRKKSSKNTKYNSKDNSRENIFASGDYEKFSHHEPATDEVDDNKLHINVGTLKPGEVVNENNKT